MVKNKRYQIHNKTQQSKNLFSWDILYVAVPYINPIATKLYCVSPSYMVYLMPHYFHQAVWNVHCDKGTIHGIFGHCFDQIITTIGL